MTPRRTRVLALGGLLIVSLGAVVMDADRRRAQWDAAERERSVAAHAVGVPGLALNSASRWLRHPVVSEPHAAQADAPLAFDSDPAGSVIGPTETSGAAP